QGTRGHEALESGETGDLESSFEERMVGICEAYASRFTIPGAEVLNELRVDTIEGRWGYCDRLVINPDNTVHLFDWKFVRSSRARTTWSASWRTPASPTSGRSRCTS
ncbi:MAG: hypothetical protein RLZZ188_3441, partial [Verrucomicrobiota bacterium]